MLQLASFQRWRPAGEGEKSQGPLTEVTALTLYIQILSFLALPVEGSEALSVARRVMILSSGITAQGDQHFDKVV